MNDPRNTSQVPEYEGPRFHEKKFHKTHFGVVRTLRKTKSTAKWVQIGVGKYKLVRSSNGKEKEN